MGPHDVLGISRTATAKEAADAYRALAQIFHPDRYSDAPDAVKAEAERRMKQLTAAYSAVKRAIEAEQASAAEDVIDLDEVDVGEQPAIAEPLPRPAGDYSGLKWDAASRRWNWSTELFAWECEHGREACPDCGRNPDVIAVHDGGVQRPANTWRKSKSGAIVCVSHRDEWCRRCRRLPDDLKRRLERSGRTDVRDARPW